MYSLKEAKNAAQDWIDELGTMDWPLTGLSRTGVM
jgi:hypothetical protein